MHSDNEMVRLRDVVETLIYMTDEDSDGVEEVMQLPIIDLVRCKECKWCFYVESDDVYACIKKGIEHKLYNPKKHFCSYGEREGE